ncbi:restriction endonuclease subunit S [Pantoea eucrina]|uniref:restriction endonuclease subunit S n=1 Tax=Pantoea eucrina TaxID=472693 RepID=UPI000A218995|nr:restriction endonuclease subunit S [Pantoea eucrina]ORM79596.1 type I restriction endonuclease subunit S [Pantoea eucrina]
MSFEQLITQHIDTWTSALQTRSTAGRGSNGKIDLYGIKKLRELILELAVRGKLVPQDPNDEPASELLKRIADEKAELVKQGKIKKQKPLPEIDEDDKPFGLPVGWEWVRLGDLSSKITDGVHHTPKYIDNGVAFISVKDINGDSISFDNCKYISQEQHDEINARCNPEERDLLICRIGTLGRVTLVNTNRPFSLFVSVGLIKPVSTLVNTTYLHRLFYSPCMLSQLENIKVGGSHTNKLNLSDIPNLLIPFPSIAEQIRIVDKLKDLMSLCDQLEQQSLTSLDAHSQLVETLLATLTNSQNAEELAENWARISQHFDTLFTTEASIDALKQIILQLAVMGKLVPQDPNDEPASELLKRIEREKVQLVKEGKIKKQKLLPPVSDDEKPFELPVGWEWITLSHLGSFSGGKTPSKMRGDYWDGDIPWVTPKDMKTRLITTSEDFVTSLAIEDGLGKVSQGSLLFVARSGILRRTFPVAITAIECTVNQDMKVLNPFILNINSYIILMMQGFEKYILNNLTKVGTTVESLLFDEFASHPFMLPPLEEQFRITNKVNEMLRICDALKSRLQSAQQTQLHLADALTDAALN